MIIHRVKINRFGCLDSFETAFGSGLNVIKGCNEAGKSTLHQALFMALMERPTRKKGNESYRSWGADRLFELEVEYELDGNGPWLLVKDFEVNSVSLQSPAGDTVVTWDAVQERMTAAIGTPSLKVFRSTVCVTQDELSAVTDGQKEIAQSLEQIVTGGEDDTLTSSVIAELDKAIQAYRRGCSIPAPKNPGPLARLISQQLECQKLADDYRSQVTRPEEARERLIAIDTRLAEIEGQLDPRLAAREQADNIHAWADALEKRRKKESEIEATVERITEAKRQLAETDAQIETLRPIAEMSDAETQSCNHLNERVSLLAEQKKNAELLVGNAPSAKPRQKWGFVARYVLAGFLLLAGGAGGVAGLLLGVVTRSGVLALVIAGVSLILLMCGLGLLIWAIFSAPRKTQQPPSVGLVNDDVNTQLAKAQSELANKLSALGCEDWTTYERKRKELQIALANRLNLQGRLDGLLPEGGTLETLENERKSISHERRDLEEKLGTPEAQRALKITALEYQSLSTEITRLVKEQEELEAEAAIKKAQLADVKITHEDLLVVEERLAMLTQEIEQTRERQEVCELALQTLQTAREKTLMRASDRLAPVAGEYLRTLTVGRYTVVAVDNNLNVLIKSPEKADGLIGPDQLSKGTQDQLYLAMRLALIDLLFPVTKPPLFLDDPFVKFDLARQQAAIGLCQTIAQQRQVFLFTCRNDFDRAGHLIELGMRP